jgi:murein DD-endopeptidase MepM/ murein hydrolase activator NlpD
MGMSLFRINQYTSAESLTEQELAELQRECDVLLEQTRELQDELSYVENKNKSSQSILNAQAEDLTERTTTYQQKLDAFTQMTAELQDKIDALAKAKQDILDKLNEIPYIDGFDEIATTDSATIMNMNYSTDPLVNLQTRFESLLRLADAEQASYEKLVTAYASAETTLNNYPTIWPVKGAVNSTYGNRTDPMGGTGSEFHSGLDIKAGMGTPVKCTGGGVVKHAGEYSSYGILVIIDHGNGIETYYAHNSEVKVSVGEKVVRGQVVALSGNTGRSTGPHVHYEVRLNGTAVNPAKYVSLMPS